MQPRLHDHFRANENQYQRQANFQVFEFIQNARKQKVKRAQAQNRKYVGGVHDKSISSDAENCRDGIDREGHIGDFHDEQHQKERSRKEQAVLPDEEFPLAIIVRQA